MDAKMDIFEAALQLPGPPPHHTNRTQVYLVHCNTMLHLEERLYKDLMGFFQETFMLKATTNKVKEDSFIRLISKVESGIVKCQIIMQMSKA